MLQPLADQIVIRLPKREEEKKVNGIIIAATVSKEADTQGEVIAIGSGRLMDDGTRVPSEVAVGDKVLFTKYAGIEITEGEDRLLILKERDLLAIIRPNEPTGIHVVH